MYVARKFKEETPNESDHPGDFECQQYLHLVEKDLGTKNGPGDGLLLDVCANERISTWQERKESMQLQHAGNSQYSTVSANRRSWIIAWARMTDE